MASHAVSRLGGAQRAESKKTFQSKMAWVLFFSCWSRPCSGPWMDSLLIRKPGSPTFWRALPSIPFKDSTNCCHGIGAAIGRLIKQLEPKLTGMRSSPDAYAFAGLAALRPLRL